MEIFNINNKLPKKDSLDYYGSEYSVPVIVKYKDTHVVLRWSYYDSGWVDQLFTNGCNTIDYKNYYGLTEWYYPDVTRDKTNIEFR